MLFNSKSMILYNIIIFPIVPEENVISHYIFIPRDLTKTLKCIRIFDQVD